MQYGTIYASPPLPLLSFPPHPLLPVAHDGTSWDDTDEGHIVGDDGGDDSRRDVTGGDDADDKANTSAECKDDENDHTPSPSQSSEHAVLMHGLVEDSHFCVGCVRIHTLQCACVRACVS